MKLRNYQNTLVDDTRTAFAKGNKIPLVVLPCGAGKTVCFADMAKKHIDKVKDGHVWFLVHRRELIDQTLETFEWAGIPTDNIFVGMVQSITRNPGKFKKPTFIIFDEAHHAKAKSWYNIIDYFKGVPMVGLTATPERADGKTLGDVFDVMVEGVEADWLIENGYLSKYKYYAPPVTDMEFKMKNIDYDLDEFSSQLLKSKIYGSISKYLNPQKKTIIYCPTIEFSKYLCEQTGATHFDGTTPAKERKQIVDDFKSGKIRALSNVNLIGEGFDVPDCDTVLLLRPTQSLALFIQQSMRCLRPAPGKEATIYDLVGNVYRHGLPTEPHIWSLTAKRKRLKNNTSEEVIVRRCQRCMLVYSGLGKVCPYCGHDNGKTRKQIEHQRAIELEEIKKVNKAKDRKMVAMARTHYDLEQIGISRGYQYPKKWASMIIASRRRRKFNT